MTVFRDVSSIQSVVVVVVSVEQLSGRPRLQVQFVLFLRLLLTVLYCHCRVGYERGVSVK